MFYVSSVGGVKRPAEGSKEEPSEKKNLPVVAKTFVSKNAIENRLPTTLTAQTSPKLARAAVQVGTHVRTHHQTFERLCTIHLCCLTILLFLTLYLRTRRNFHFSVGWVSVNKL